MLPVVGVYSGGTEHVKDHSMGAVTVMVPRIIAETVMIILVQVSYCLFLSLLGAFPDHFKRLIKKIHSNIYNYQ